MSKTMKRGRETRMKIINVALAMAEEVGYMNLRRDDIAERAEVGMGTVTYHYSSIGQLKRDVVRHAIVNDNYIVMGQALGMRDPQVMKLDEVTRENIIKMLTV